MNFESRRLPLLRPSWRAFLLAALTLLASCGGGERGTQFVPTRVLAFGDESSVITSAGKKYTVNAFDVNGVLNCTLSPVWAQQLAAAYGLTFAQCPGTATQTRSINYAAPGAKVADVTAQIAAHRSADAFKPGDLVTIQVGANDVLEQYALYPAQSEAALVTALEARGVALAAQVNALSATGAKVLVVTVLDLSVTPFGFAEQAAHNDRAAVLARLTDRFNVAMSVGLINDGKKIGLVNTGKFTVIANSDPGFYGFVNVSAAACTVALPDCTTQTLAAGASGISWMWADATQLSAGGHAQLATIVEAIAFNNPF